MAGRGMQPSTKITLSCLVLTLHGDQQDLDRNAEKEKHIPSAWFSIRWGNGGSNGEREYGAEDAVKLTDTLIAQYMTAGSSSLSTARLL